MRFLALLLLVLAQPEPLHTRPALLSHTPTGLPGGGASGVRGLALSANGRFTAFASEADDLLPGDDNRRLDVYLHDRQGGLLERISVDADGRSGDAPSLEPDLSDDGQRVVFSSFATTLDPLDDTPWADIFLRDRSTDTTRRLSVPRSGRGTDGSSSAPSLSADGRLVVYTSFASDLVPDDQNDDADVFLFDLETGETRCLSRALSGGTGRGASSAPTLSGDGRRVAFVSEADDLVPHDDNGAADVFLLDLESGELRRLNLGPDGEQADAGCGLFPSVSLSRTGRFCAFVSCAGNLVPGLADAYTERVYLFDLDDDSLRLVSVTSDGRPVDGRCFAPSVSDDGLQVVFQTAAPVLTGGGGLDDVFVHDRRDGITRVLPTLPPRDDAALPRGSPAPSGPAVLAGSGEVVVFASDASDLVPGDDNDATDVFQLRL